MPESERIIQVQGLHQAFGSQVVLDNLDFAVHRGESVAILGSSGSGKSTLLRTIIGLNRPEQGTVKLLGVDPYRDPDHKVARMRERIGMAFQAGALFGSMTVGQNVEIALTEFTELPASTREIIVKIKLALVGLADAIERYPSELSGGMKKRAALARAMALDPEILFFDEPTAGLDPITAAGIDQLILELKDVFGVTLVVVTHELTSAFTVADRIALMHQGRFLIVGTPEELRSCPNPIVRRFLDRKPEEHQPAREVRFLDWLGRSSGGEAENG